MARSRPSESESSSYIARPPERLLEFYQKISLSPGTVSFLATWLAHQRRQHLDAATEVRRRGKPAELGPDAISMTKTMESQAEIDEKIIQDELAELLRDETNPLVIEVVTRDYRKVRKKELVRKRGYHRGLVSQDVS